LLLNKKNYDINDTDLLGFYVKGASVAPRILENLKDGMKSLNGITPWCVLNSIVGLSVILLGRIWETMPSTSSAKDFRGEC